MERDDQFVSDLGVLWVERKDRAGRDLIVGSCFSEPGRFGVQYSGIEGWLCTSLAEIKSASPESLVWIDGFLHGSMPAAKSDDPDYLREWEAARVEFLHSGNWRWTIPILAFAIWRLYRYSRHSRMNRFSWRELDG